METLDVTIRSFGPLFDAEELDKLISRYAFPVLISKSDGQQVFDHPEALRAKFDEIRSFMRALGGVLTRTSVVSQAVVEDTAFVFTENEFCDADGHPLKTSKIHYVLHHLDQGWRICLMDLQGERWVDEDYGTLEAGHSLV